MQLGPTGAALPMLAVAGPMGNAQNPLLTDELPGGYPGIDCTCPAEPAWDGPPWLLHSPVGVRRFTAALPFSPFGWRNRRASEVVAASGPRACWWGQTSRSALLSQGRPGGLPPREGRSRTVASRAMAPGGSRSPYRSTRHLGGVAACREQTDTASRATPARIRHCTTMPPSARCYFHRDQQDRPLAL